MIGNFIFSLLAKLRKKSLKLPLNNIKQIALRPSTINGESLYSLPIVKALSEDHILTLFLPFNGNTKYFRRFKVKIIEYPEKLNFLKVFNFKRRLGNSSFDLFINLDRNNIDTFSFILNNPLTASIYEGASVNLLTISNSTPINELYGRLSALLGFKLQWGKELIRIRKRKYKEKKMGITFDIGKYPGFLEVKKAEDLYKISSLITRKNQISTIAFFLDIPQVLLLKEGDEFRPPASIKVVRYSKSVTGDIIENCLKML
jgi:hypothetical protein